MATSKTVSVTISVSPALLARILSGEGMFKAVTVTAIANKPLAPTIGATLSNARVYDIPLCDVKERERVSKAFDPLRGSGMIARVTDTFKITYGQASALVSAESAARKNGTGIMCDSKSRENTEYALKAVLSKK